MRLSQTPASSAYTESLFEFVVFVLQRRESTLQTAHVPVHQVDGLTARLELLLLVLVQHLDGVGRHAAGTENGQRIVRRLSNETIMRRHCPYLTSGRQGDPPS